MTDWEVVLEIYNRYSTDNEQIVQILDDFKKEKTSKIKSGEFVF